MKLIDFEPRFINTEGREGVGVRFTCPCGCDRPVVMYFINPLDGGPSVAGDYYSWERIGDTFEDMTLKPSIKRECGWCGTITNGRIVE